MSEQDQITKVVASISDAVAQVKTDLDAFIAQQSPDVAAAFRPVLDSINALDAEVQAASVTPTATTTPAP